MKSVNPPKSKRGQPRAKKQLVSMHKNRMGESKRVPCLGSECHRTVKIYKCLETNTFTIGNRLCEACRLTDKMRYLAEEA